MKKVLSWLLILVLFVTVLPALPAGAETGDIDMLVLPDEMKRIGNKAFAGNTSLKTVIVPNTVTSIGSKAFANCTGIEEVVLASRTISIAEDAFEGCGDIIFSAHNGSDAELFALSNGYRCESLDDGSEYLARFDEMMSHRGFNPGVLMDDTFDSKCLIVRTDGTNRLPDISAYNPIDIFRSENNLFYIQFTNEDDTENCWTFLSSDSTVMWAVPDQIATNNEVSGQSVTKESNWGTSDVMGFNVYSQFVADHDPRSKVTVAVVDSGADVGSWAGIYSAKSRSYVGGNASGSHGSKIASIISDCLGVNVGRCELLSVKVMNSGSEYRTTTIIEGLKYAIDNGANVINLSIGMDNTNPEIAYQISRAVGKGIQVVVAAGNGSGPVMFPANCSGALAVSALTYNSTTGYGVKSRTGSEIDYTAPGHYLRTAAYPTVNEGDILGSASTSFATPQIVAALTLIRLDSTKSDPIGTLNSCCEMPGTLGSSAVGHGLPRLDRLAAINVIDFTLENMDGGDIPASMWAGESFMLTWSVVPENATEKAAIIDASDPKVLTVKNFGSSAMVTAKGVGTSTLTVTIGNISKQISLSVRQPVTNIEIIGAPKEIYAGKTAQMSLAITPANAENKAVIWSSSDESIAAISQNGLLTAKKVGKVRITCEAQDGYGTTATVDVTVLDIPDPVEITLTAKEKDISSQIVELEVGNILTLTAHIKPDEAIQEAQYTVFPSGIVTVTSDGILTAVAPGSAFLTAKATANNLVATQLAVTVVVKPKTLTVTADKDVLNIGETTNVYGTVSPANATDKSVTWKSQNPTVASVNDRGVVTALSSGTAIITGTTSNGIQDAISITVRKPITITFNPGEGSCSESKRTAYVGSPVGTLPTPVRQYYTFTGWYTTGGTKITDASVLNADTVLYARWLGIEYNITFDANGGTCSETKGTARVGSAIGTLPTPTRDYYTFDGWYTAKEGGTQIISTYVQNNTAELKLYAHWVKDLFTMKFNANGGTCNPTSKNYPVDTKVGPLPTPTKDYSDFLGWFTSATGGTQITADYEQSTTATITVYAHWAWKPYTMTFNATENGGSGSTSKTFYVNTAVGTLPTATKAYYDFKGWYTAASGGTQVTASYIQSTNSNITVYAQFSPYPYTMTFNATTNKGSCSTASKTCYVDTAAGTLPTATKNYYTFKGWYTAASGVTQVTASYIQSTNAPITVYAQFDPNPYKMTFNATTNKGSCSTSSKTCYVDTAIGTGTLPTATKAYYDFKGWYTAASGGTQITASYIQSTDANITVYAQFSPKPYTMTFNATANGGSGSTSKTYYVDTAVGTLPTATKAYYDFKGWYTTADGNTQVTASYTQSTDANITVYAQFTPLPFFMTFNVVASDAFCNESTRTCYVDTPIGPLPVPTRPYYSFDGWYTAASGGTKVTATTYSTNANVMLYAHWTPNTFNITFNLNTTDAASCDITSMTGTVGVALSALPTPCRTFYRFIGWNTMSNGNGTMIAAGNQIQSAEPLTLYAQWTEVNHDEYLNQYGFTYVTREPVVYTVNAGGADIMRYPYSTGVVKLGHDDAGQKEVTAAIVRNNNGELWLINPSGTAFVKLSQVTFYETVEATFTVTDGQIPEGQIRQSTPFLVKGIIASDADMTRVTAGVYQNGACVSNGGSPISCNLNQGTSFSLAATDIGKELDFYHLAPGDYEFKVDIEYGSHNQSKTVVQTAFTITAYTGATSFKIYDFDYLRYMLNDNIENGWAVIGKVASDVNITNISILVKRADGTTITGPITAAPNTKGYDLNKLDGKVLFSKCTANKKHAYIVTAKDAAGRTLELFVVMEGRSSSAGGAKWVRDYVKVYTEPTLVKQWHNDDKIYMCFNSNVNLDTAKSYASSIGGQLACITSAEENAFIAANMPTAAQCYLIGGYKSGSAFVWCSGESMSYTNYNTGEPNNWCGVENYLAIRSADGKWCDEHSGYSEQLGGFIVEIPCSSY